MAISDILVNITKINSFRLTKTKSFSDINTKSSERKLYKN